MIRFAIIYVDRYTVWFGTACTYVEKWNSSVKKKKKTFLYRKAGSLSTYSVINTECLTASRPRAFFIVLKIMKMIYQYFPKTCFTSIKYDNILRIPGSGYDLHPKNTGQDTL